MHGMTLPEWTSATMQALDRIGERVGQAVAPITESEARWYCDCDPTTAAALIAFGRVNAHRLVGLEDKTRVLDMPMGRA